jgi:hypothetical protein
MGDGTTRRTFFRLLAGAALLPAADDAAFARKVALIGRLIDEARPLPQVAQRIDFISARLLGIRYEGHTLIGGPNHPERFVIRDDAFDCVTFCEVALAAGIARDLSEFETALRRIRYEHGVVRWHRRNHYFADWAQRNIENGVCRPVELEQSVTYEKAVSWHPALGRRLVSIVGVPRTAFLGSEKSLAAGDIIGFTSRRSELDYFHTGLVAFGADGTLLLRHASKSRGRVLEEPMAAFVNANPVRYVTLLRARELDGAPPAATAAAAEQR